MHIYMYAHTRTQSACDKIFQLILKFAQSNSDSFTMHDQLET